MALLAARTANSTLIEEGVLSMLRVNMRLGEGERLLVVTDPPNLAHWQDKDPSELMSQLERSMLAKMVAEIAKEAFPHSIVEFCPYPSVGMHGREPGEVVAEKMCQADVVIAITNYSLSHTAARADTTGAGGRIASRPDFLARMFHPGGPMTVDYHQVAADSEGFAELITAAQSAIVRSPAGTDIRFSLAGRSGGDTGLCTAKGAWSNLPAGEAYAAPVEGTAQGVMVVQAGWYSNLTEEMTLRVNEGLVVRIEDGGEVGEKLRKLLKLDSDAEIYEARRNLAELAIGDNSHIGGTVTADLHQDFVIPEPDLLLDDKLVIGGVENVNQYDGKPRLSR